MQKREDRSACMCVGEKRKKKKKKKKKKRCRKWLLTTCSLALAVAAVEVCVCVICLASPPLAFVCACIVFARLLFVCLFVDWTTRQVSLSFPHLRLAVFGSTMSRKKKHAEKNSKIADRKRESVCVCGVHLE